MSRQLVFVHGRAQQQKDPAALEALVDRRLEAGARQKRLVDADRGVGDPLSVLRRHAGGAGEAGRRPM